jgi:hypothetical protein
MTAPAADHLCCRVVELAARVLPAEQRQRYALEFIAELYGMPRSQQVRHSIQVLAHAWALRTVLTATSGARPQEGTMTRTTRRPFRCLLRIHRWHWLSTEDGERYECCLRCGLDRTERVSGLHPRTMIGM